MLKGAGGSIELQKLAHDKWTVAEGGDTDVDAVAVYGRRRVQEVIWVRSDRM